MARAITILICFCCGLAGVASADPVEWPESAGGNGHYYDAVVSSVGWEAARATAAGMMWAGAHGHLATITSEAENQFVLDSIGGRGGYWLGGYQPAGSQEPSGGWTWVTGEPWGYANWVSGEPNNDGDEKYLMTIWWNVTNLWNDEETIPYEVHGFYVEFDPNLVDVARATWGSVKALFRE